MDLNEALETLKGLTEDQAAVKIDDMGAPAIILEAYDKMVLEGTFKPEPQKIVIPVWTPTANTPVSKDIDKEIYEIQNLDNPKAAPEIKYEPEAKPQIVKARPEIKNELNEITKTNPEIIQTLIEEIDKANHKKTHQQFIDEHSDYVSDLIADGISKKERAKIVYNLKKDHPQISISPMLYLFEVGESTFRTERLIHKIEWDIEYKEQQIRNARWLIFDVLKNNSEEIGDMFLGIDVKRVFEIVNKAQQTKER